VPVPPIDRFFWFVAGCALVTTISYFLISPHIPATGKPTPLIAPPLPGAGELAR
jgi:hypothetical protein